MEKFFCRTRILSGPGCIRGLKDLKARRVFLVTDPYFVNSGMADKVLSAAGAEESEIFGRVEPDPDIRLAAEGAAAFRRFSPDLLIALGGGSSMDCAKAILYFGEKTVPLAAIPTTSGSGSEVTNFAVLTHDGIKHPLVEERLQPDYAYLDPELLTALPRSLIADAGFDVLTHALEAIGARGAGILSDLLAEKAFSLTYRNLLSSYKGNVRARLPVHQGATMAGMAFQAAGLGLCHAMAHALGGQFHVPHGRLNAILLPEVLLVNEQAAGHKYAELARAAGLGGAADTVALRNLHNGLIKLRRQLNLPETLKGVGVAPADVASQREALQQAVLADPCCETNPLPVTGNMVGEILQKVMGHD